MIIKSKTNEKSFIEIKDRITTGIRDRYLFMQNPKVKYNSKGEVEIDMSAQTEYECNPNLYLLSKCIITVNEEGVDKTPKSDKLSDLLKLLDENFYDNDLLKDTIQKALELYGFLDQKKNEKEKKERSSSK